MGTGVWHGRGTLDSNCGMNVVMSFCLGTFNSFGMHRKKLGLLLSHSPMPISYKVIFLAH